MRRALGWMAAATVVAALMCGACEREAANVPPRPARATPQRQVLPPGQAQADNGASVITAGQIGDGGGRAGAGSGAPGDPMPAAEPIHHVIAAPADGKVPVLVWDLSEDRSPEKIGWPKNQGNNKVYSIEGNFAFDLKVQDKKNFSGRVRQVESRRKGGLIDGVEITSEDESTDKAYQRTKGMLKDLGFGAGDLQKLDAWHEKAKAGNYDNLQLRLKNSYDRVYTVHVTNDGTSEQPWSVGLDIDWSQVCGCHG